jgi:aryl-alcohol dehydrogenase-like predicted oxidoreductase
MSESPLAAWSARRPEGSPIRIALGTMNFGKRTPEPLARQIIDRALSQGITFLDTANSYNDGESERIVGRAIAGRRDRFIVATKVGLARHEGKNEGLSRARIIEACDASLARMKTEYIDVYYLHAPDPSTPIDETLSAIEELLSAGKVRGWAVSNYASWQILEMQVLCEKRGMVRPILSQVIYNVLLRQLEVEYFKFAAHVGLHTIIYNPLAGGFLSGRYRPEDTAVSGSRFDSNVIYRRRYWSPRLFELVEAYRSVAQREGMSLVELSYAWVAERGGVDSMLIGPATIEHLDAALVGNKKVLSRGARREIDDIHLGYLGTDASYAR